MIPVLDIRSNYLDVVVYIKVIHVIISLRNSFKDKHVIHFNHHCYFEMPNELNNPCLKQPKCSDLQIWSKPIS